LEIAYSQPKVQDLFKVNYQYRVPAYQRPYAWQATNVDDFWGDISSIDSAEHFLGPMVLHKSGDDIREVIDGQQRLTTLQMLIALIRDKYIEMGDPVRDPDQSGDRCSAAPSSLIRNTGYSTQYFLRSGDHNRPILEDFILRAPDDPFRKSLDNKKEVEGVKKAQWAKNKPLLEAYTRLKTNIDEYLGKSKRGPEAALRRLEDALVRRVTLVVLDLSSLDDAFLLFETLNDRGLRLSAADLLKSHLLSKVDKKHPDDASALDEASDSWDELVEVLGGGDISGFLRHYLLMRHKRVMKSDVFPFFKKDVFKLGPDKVLQELKLMGGHYAEFLRPPQDDEAVYEVLSGLIGTSVDTHRIALMPARAYSGTTRFIQFARVAEILSFRWTVCGKNAQDLESLYQEAAEAIYASEGGQIDEAEALLVSSFPDSAEFRSAFENESLGYVYVAAYALRKIELAIEPTEKTIKPNQWVNIEHIMPKTPTPFWEERETAEAAYEAVVQRWGNLTLLFKPLNESIGNGDWDTKRFGKLGKDGKPGLPGYKGSSIRLTQDLVQLDEWNSDQIELRAKWLAAAAPMIWSLTPGLQGFPSFLDVVANPSLIENPSKEKAP
jgi:hypothetical protein